MAIASVGTLGTGASSSNGTTLSLTPSAQLDAGNVGIIVVSANNTGTTDADHSQVTAVNDSVGNTYTKLGEWTNGQGAADAGVTVSVWMTRATTNLSTSGAVTVTFGSAITDKCCSMWEFTAGAKLRLAAPVNPNATDGANGYGSVTISSLPSKQYLFLRGLAKEANSTTNITPSASFTAMTAMRSRNNANAVLVRGEFRIVTTTSQTSNPTLAVVGDTAGVFVALEEGYTGSAAVAHSGATCAGVATFVGASFPATAAVTVGEATASGSAGFAHHPVGRLTQPRHGVWGRRYVSFVGKIESPPFIEGVATITLGAATCVASGFGAAPHPVGQITQARHALSGRNYGTFVGKGGTHGAAAAVTVGAATASGVAEFDAPTYTAAAAITAGGATCAATAQFASIFAASAAVSIAPATATGAATFRPLRTAQAAVSVGAATCAGVAAFTAPVYTASAAVSAAAATCAGLEAPEAVFTGSAAVSAPRATCAGTAAVSKTGTAAVTAPRATCAGTATAATPPYIASAAVVAPAATCAGTATRALPPDAPAVVPTFGTGRRGGTFRGGGGGTFTGRRQGAFGS